jgi:hypothetical protein
VKILTTRLMAAACGLLVTLTAVVPSAFAQQTSAAAKPLATVVFSSYDELMKDADFVGNLGGMPNASQMLNNMVMSFTQQKGLAGLDKSKPIGVIVQSSGDMPGGAVCLPVTDLNALLDVVKGFGITAKDAGNGLQQVSTPQGQSVFLKNTSGWALLSLSPDMINAVPADPGSVLAPLAKDYDLAVQLHVQNVPETYRQQAVEAMSQGAQQGMNKKDGESDEDYAQRQKMVQMQLDELKRFVNELDQFTVGLSIDGKGQRAYLDIAYTGVPGSKLAKDLAVSNDAKTNFAGFVQPNSAMTFSSASKVTDSNAAQLDQMMDSVTSQMKTSLGDKDELNDEQKDKVKSAVDDFMSAAKATLKSGTIDAAGSLTLTAESLTFVAGGHVAEPKKIESGFKKIFDVAKEKHGEEAPKATWDAEKYGDVTFHKLAKDVPADKEDARKLLGDTVEMYVGIGKDAVYFSAGRDALDAVKKAIDASKASANKATTPGEVTFALGQIMTAAQTMAQDDQKPQIQMISDMLANQAKDRDHVRMVAQPIENGVRMRIEAEEGVLRAIGMAAMQAQMRGAGQ